MAFSSASLITLTTDFGLADPYVGQMKGAILSRNLTARLVDLCHAIPPQDILAAAVVLQSSWKFFPAGTLHLAVVDPGVGSGRRILVCASADQLFIAQDNGLLSPLMADGTIQRVRLLENPALFASEISPTFHGRDIMAPAAALLAGGFPFYEVGPLAASASCVHLDLPKAQRADGALHGTVIHVDQFGNLRTSITTADMRSFAPLGEIVVSIKGQQVQLGRTYAAAPPGTLLAVLDSAGWLEIAANTASAAQMLGCGIGEQVAVFRFSQAEVLSG